MNRNMHRQSKKEYRNNPVAGRHWGKSATGIQRTSGQRHIARETHALVIEATENGVHQERFADWWYDLRRKNLRIYGGLLRFIDLAHARGIAKSKMLMIPEWIRAYIEDLYDGGGPSGFAGATA